MSAGGSTGRTTGRAAAVVSAVASMRVRSRPGRACSHPSMAPRTRRYGDEQARASYDPLPDGGSGLGDTGFGRRHGPSSAPNHLR